MTDGAPALSNVPTQATNCYVIVTIDSLRLGFGLGCAGICKLRSPPLAIVLHTARKQSCIKCTYEFWQKTSPWHWNKTRLPATLSLRLTSTSPTRLTCQLVGCREQKTGPTELLGSADDVGQPMNSTGMRASRVSKVCQ